MMAMVFGFAINDFLLANSNGGRGQNKKQHQFAQLSCSLCCNRVIPWRRKSLNIGVVYLLLSKSSLIIPRHPMRWFSKHFGMMVYQSHQIMVGIFPRQITSINNAGYHTTDTGTVNGTIKH